MSKIKKYINYVNLSNTLLTGTLIMLTISAAIYKYNSEISSVEINIENKSGGQGMIMKADISEHFMTTFNTDFVGYPIGMVDVEIIETSLNEIPFVKNADVYVDARGIMHVDMEQRIAMLRIQQKGGGGYYMDREGNRMPLSMHYAARIPVITGELPMANRGSLLEQSAIFGDIYALGRKIESDEFLRSLIEQIHVNANGKYIIIPKIGSEKIELGDIKNIDRKLNKLKKFYKGGLALEGWNKYELINLEFEEQVVCRKRKNS